MGLHDLSRHKPRSALHHLSTALKLCPEQRGCEMARILFYLGMTMRKLGLRDPSIRSWSAAQRIRKRGFGRKMLGRYTNAYGMERQTTTEEDDWQAFRSVQLRRYLRSRKKRRFRNGTEAALLNEIVHRKWEDLRRTRHLSAMSSADKSALFKSLQIDVAHGQEPIPVSFATGKRVAFDDRCPCGSGRSYGSCCGRTEGVEEYTTGTQ